MSDRVPHCPFLNRADTRCSNHFSLDRLGHAFEHCFDQYKTCPTYLELLVERRVRRRTDAVLYSIERTERTHANAPCVQLRIPTPSAMGSQISDGYQKSVA